MSSLQFLHIEGKVTLIEHLPVVLGDIMYFLHVNDSLLNPQELGGCFLFCFVFTSETVEAHKLLLS